MTYDALCEVRGYNQCTAPMCPHWTALGSRVCMVCMVCTVCMVRTVRTVRVQTRTRIAWRMWVVYTQ